MGNLTLSPPALVVHDEQAFSKGMQVPQRRGGESGAQPVVIVYGSGGGSVMAVRQALFGIDSIERFPDSITGLLNGEYKPNAHVIWVSRDPDMSDAVPARTTRESLQAFGQNDYLPPPGTGGYKNFLGEIVYNMALKSLGVSIEDTVSKVATFAEYDHKAHAFVPGGKERTIVFDQFVEAVGAGGQLLDIYSPEFGVPVALTVDLQNGSATAQVPYATGFNNTHTDIRVFGAAATSSGLWKTTSAQRGDRDSFITKLDTFMANGQVPAAASFLGAVPSLLTTLRLFATKVLKREGTGYAKEINVRFDLELMVKRFLLDHANLTEEQVSSFLKKLRVLNVEREQGNASANGSGFLKYPSGATCTDLRQLLPEEICIKSGTATTLVLASVGPCSTECV